MAKDYFTFRPVFKLVVSGNHKPALRNVDAAMSRRMRLLPWLVQPSDPDKGLELALREEWGGILQWMIDGCWPGWSSMASRIARRSMSQPVTISRTKT